MNQLFKDFPNFAGRVMFFQLSPEELQTELFVQVSLSDGQEQLALVAHTLLRAHVDFGLDLQLERVIG